MRSGYSVRSGTRLIPHRATATVQTILSSSTPKTTATHDENGSLIGEPLPFGGFRAVGDERGGAGVFGGDEAAVGIGPERDADALVVEVEDLPGGDRRAAGDQWLGAGALRGDVPAVRLRLEADRAVRVVDELELFPVTDGGTAGDQRFGAGAL